MIYFLALIPATALTVAGYIVLYISGRTEGGLKTFGKYLSFWAFTLAALVILGAIFAAAAHHHRHAGESGRGMHHGMHGPWRGPGPRFFGPGPEGWRGAGPGEHGPPPPAGGGPAAAAPPAASAPAAPAKTP